MTTGTIIGLTLFAVLLVLTCLEIARYARAARDAESLPYPRKRLSRRLAVAQMFGCALLLATFWPSQAAPGLQFGLLLLLLIALGVGFLLLLRDLHETSTSVVREADRLNRDFDSGLRLQVKDRERDPTPPGKP